MIRAIPSNASDNVYCTLLAQSAVHGAMAGYTGFTVGPVNGRHAYIPFNVSYISSHSHLLVLHIISHLSSMIMAQYRFYLDYDLLLHGALRNRESLRNKTRL